ncbi:hypothetical protein ZIOFF_071631 [Zingiber officinale]|uniref:Uncharacterized protein n=1 Tax=Zingiber officinale TaxID=94328 RepID=A0A8J5C9X9_ZINOF|nr:hypothetical protein ZIOFF_071631 [Zingiber officinale]
MDILDPKFGGEEAARARAEEIKRIGHRSMLTKTKNRDLVERVSPRQDEEANLTGGILWFKHLALGVVSALFQHKQLTSQVSREDTNHGSLLSDLRFWEAWIPSKLLILAPDY